MPDITKFWGEYIVPPEERERDRWVSTAFCAVAIVGCNGPWEAEFLRRLLETKFSDVPDNPPPSADTEAYAKYAVKLLLRALCAKATAP